MSFQTACATSWNKLDFAAQADVVNDFVNKVNDFESSLFYSKSELREDMVGKSFTTARRQFQKRHDRFFCAAILDFFT